MKAQLVVRTSTRLGFEFVSDKNMSTAKTFPLKDSKDVTRLALRLDKLMTPWKVELEELALWKMQRKAVAHTDCATEVEIVSSTPPSVLSSMVSKDVSGVRPVNRDCQVVIAGVPVSGGLPLSALNPKKLTTPL